MDNREKEKINLINILRLSFHEERRIIYLDETIFQSRELSDSWAPPNQYIQCQTGKSATNVCLIAAIDVHGLVHYQLIKGYINVKIYTEFLEGLSKKIY